MDRIKSLLPPYLIFFLFFLCISGFGYRLAYLPFVLIGIIEIFFIGDLTFLLSPDYGGALLFYLIFFLVAFFIYHFIIRKNNIFGSFLFTILIFIITYVVSFYPLYWDNPQIGIYLLLLVFSIIQAISFYFIKKLIINNKIKQIILVIPLVVIMILIFLDSFYELGFFPITSLFIPWGEWMRDVVNINIFYISLSGSAFLYLNTLVLILSWVSITINFVYLKKFKK